MHLGLHMSLHGSVKADHDGVKQFLVTTFSIGVGYQVI